MVDYKRKSCGDKNWKVPLQSTNHFVEERNKHAAKGPGPQSARVSLCVGSKGKPHVDPRVLIVRSPE